jgi:hypothetical protein
MATTGQNYLPFVAAMPALPSLFPLEEGDAGVAATAFSRIRGPNDFTLMVIKR